MMRFLLVIGAVIAAIMVIYVATVIILLIDEKFR
jgi:hypothetical protein